MRNNYYLILALAFFIIFINYSFVDSLLIETFEEEYETGIVERVVDGDTVVLRTTKYDVSGIMYNVTEKIRMLGINSPESGEVGYDEAKEFLIREIEGKKVILKFGKNKFDRYKRKLAYVFLGNKNVNLESVQRGCSSFYFPSGKDKYYSLFLDAWNNCMINDAGICEKSLENCIILKKWEYDNDLVVLKNICSYSIDLNGWSVKDEGRKKYVFSNERLGEFSEIYLTSSDWDEDYVWTKSGDSIFIRDDKNKLVSWETY